MIIRPDQLAFIRTPGFDYDAAFLERMGILFDDYFRVDGMLAAGESPGPLTEICENHALLLEVIDGAKRLTTPEDQSRVHSIERLNVSLAALQQLCRERTGGSVEALIALRAKPDRFDAPFLNKVGAVVSDWLMLRRVLLARGSEIDPEDTRKHYDLLGEAIESALDSPQSDDLSKVEAIERLQRLRDKLREML